MFVNKVEVLDMAKAMARHAAAQQATSARNIANADTPGYTARSLKPFSEIWEDRGQALRATRASHINGGNQLRIASDVTNRNQSPNENSVSLEAEMMRAADARQMHEMALAIQRSLSTSIRAGLGRR